MRFNAAISTSKSTTEVAIKISQSSIETGGIVIMMRLNKNRDTAVSSVAEADVEYEHLLCLGSAN